MGNGLRQRAGARLIAIVFTIGVCGLAGIGRGNPLRAQDDASKRGGEKPNLTERYYLAKTCGRCHTTDRGQVPDPHFVKHEEFVIWGTKDKHSKAFAMLKNSRSKQMGALLGWDVEHDVRCLSCHGPAYVDPRAKDTHEKKADPALVAELTADGVSCASCHGPYTEWVAKHSELEGEEKWIALAADVKRDQYGMNDLRNAAARAEVCASCHVGNADKGRVVTHAMYAAGHPPLPGLEVATFSEAEPPHWWPMKEVPYLQKSPEKIQKLYHIDEFATQHAKLVAIGGAIALRDAAKLFAKTAAAPSFETTPDFARFDCASCHHELTVSEDSFRQRRGFEADPGRPPAPYWPAALARIAIAGGDRLKAADRSKLLEVALQAYRKAVGDRPFGDASKAIAAANALEKWSDELIAELDAKPMNREAALRMLRQITQTIPPDHASARQLVWGFRTIYNELDSKPANDQAIREKIQALMDRLAINLTPGQQGGIERQIGARLDADDQFDPKAIASVFSELDSLLR